MLKTNGISELLFVISFVMRSAQKCWAQLFEGRLAPNPGFFFLCSKAFSRIIFSVIFRASNHHLAYRQKELKLKCFLSFQIRIRISH